MKMQSQEQHRIDYLGWAYKEGFTLQLDIGGEWMDADPKDRPDLSPWHYPHLWRVKEPPPTCSPEFKDLFLR